MRYIGSFFRINSLTPKEIENQLFFLSREAIKHIVLKSRCGLIAPMKNSKKHLSNNDINILKDFSPLLCIYRKGHPKFTSSKHHHGWDEDGIKKEVTPSSNALMTLCILELTSYYDKFKEINENISSLSNIYKNLARSQLEFYSSYLRNAEGFFVDKKNTLEGNADFNFIDKDKKFKFSDQAFMMVAYYLYWSLCTEDPEREMFKTFSMDILNMFLSCKDEIYNLSFEECCKIALAFNCFYSYSLNNDAKLYIIDISDFLIDKYEEKNHLLGGIDYSCLLAINLLLSYKHSGVQTFKDNFIEISEKHKNLYNEECGIFIKPMEKKEIKYDLLEINNYLLNMLFYEEIVDSSRDIKTMLSTLYKQFYINPGIVLCWPEAPSLDSEERYKNLTLKSEDLIEESMFRMPNAPTPESTGTAPIFIKSVTYSRKKEIFSSSKTTFDSSKNFLSFYLIIFLLKEKIMDCLFCEGTNETEDGILDSDQ